MTMLENLKRQVAAQFDDSDVPQNIKTACREYLAPVQTDLLSMDAEGERVRFIHEYIEREYELAQADSHDDHTYDGDEDHVELRDDPLCTCRDPNCYLKQGRVPLLIQLADTFDDGMQQFRQEHPGSPLVLDEAQKADTNRRVRVFNALLTVNIAMSNKTMPDEVDPDDKKQEVYA